MILMGVTSCDVSRAALGACEIDCTSAAAGSFTVCASQGQSSVGQVPSSSGGSSSKSKPKPQRSCQYYVNGTIDVPTIGIITAWVDVGSRLCIGDPVPATTSPIDTKPKSVETQIQEQFTAVSKAPYAWWNPGDSVEMGEPASFHVTAGAVVENGRLFDQSALIRFRPVDFRWAFSDRYQGSGKFFVRAFEVVGIYQATAIVDYQVDYKIGSGSWNSNAASWSLESNQLSVVVIDPPRRTLLVD